MRWRPPRPLSLESVTSEIWQREKARWGFRAARTSREPQRARWTTTTERRSWQRIPSWLSNYNWTKVQMRCSGRRFGSVEAEGNHGVDARGASCRYVGCHNGDEQEKQRGDG